jgi:hypothetical protein
MLNQIEMTVKLIDKKCNGTGLKCITYRSNNFMNVLILYLQHMLSWPLNPGGFTNPLFF